MERYLEQMRQMQQTILQMQQQMQDQAAAMQQPAPHAEAGPASTGLRVKLPAGYDGTTDVSAWLFSLELAFEGSETPASRHVAIASSLLQGDAAIWFRARAASRTAAGQNHTGTWNDFVSDIRLQFTPVNAQQAARDRLAALQQTSSVRQYINQFRSIGLQIADMGPADRVDKFKRGLKPAIRVEVEIQGCTTLEECERVAERVDTILSHGVRSGGYRYNAHSSAPPSAYHGPAPMDLGAMAASPSQAHPQMAFSIGGHGGHNYFPYPTILHDAYHGPTPTDFGATAVDPPPTRTQMAPPHLGAVTHRLPTNPSQRTKLTPQERAYLIANNGCLYCRALGHWAGDCPAKPPRPAIYTDRPAGRTAPGNGQARR